MSKTIIITVCSLLLAMPALGSAVVKEERKTNVLPCDQAAEDAKFQCNQELFNSEVNEAIRAKKQAEKDAAETKKKTEEAQDKGEGQVRIKF